MGTIPQSVSQRRNYMSASFLVFFPGKNIHEYIEQIKRHTYTYIHKYIDMLMMQAWTPAYVRAEQT